MTLLDAAILGTAKLPDGGASASPVAAPLLAELTTEREASLLLSAGVDAVYRSAGFRDRSIPVAPAPAPEESREVCPSDLAELVLEMLAGRCSPLLPEAARLINEHAGRLPFAMLPRVLDVIDGRARRALFPIAGERGGWLARFNPRWSWAVAGGVASRPLPADADRLWEEGSLGERRALLIRVRAEDSARGRALLASVFAKEKADQRATFLECLATGLSLDDETFLESALDDRSSAVRGAAAEILCRLPGSALSARMSARADELLFIEAAREPKGLVARMKSLGGSRPRPTMRVEPPRAPDSAAERDGIPKKPPQGVGERAFWLAEILSRVSPAHWADRSGETEADIVACALASEWREPLVTGLRGAAIRFASGGWASALWDDAARRHEASREAQELLALLPGTELEERALSLLQEPASPPPFAPPLFERVPVPWSEALSRRYVAALRVLVEKARGGAEIPAAWRQTLPSAAIGLAHSALDQAIGEGTKAPIGERDEPESDGSRDIALFADVISFRRRIIESIERWPR